MIIPAIILCIIIALILSFQITIYNYTTWFIDFFHIFITYFQFVFVFIIFVEIVCFKKFDLNKLFILNIFFIVMISGIVHFGMCPLTILYNNLTHLPKCTPFLWKFHQRFNDKVALPPDFFEQNSQCEKNTRSWLKSQTYPVLILLSLNIIFFINRFRN